MSPFKNVCINNPHWQSSRIIIFFCKYDIAISETLVGSFLDVIFSELHEKPRRKDKSQKKVHGRICVRLSLLWLNALLSISFFVAFFAYSIPILKWCTCWVAPIKIYNIEMVGILCDDTMSEQSKIWKYYAI